MNLKNVSALKYNLILQALGTWKSCKQDTDIFLDTLLDLGWEDSILYHEGSFKTCIWKKSIVAKFAKSDSSDDRLEVEREYEQYQTIPWELRKYFARSYVMSNGLLIQDRVLVQCMDRDKCNMNDILSKFDYQLCDYTHNHGHSRKGTIKFFDWVFKRRSIWMDDSDEPLVDNNEKEKLKGVL